MTTVCLKVDIVCSELAVGDLVEEDVNLLAVHQANVALTQQPPDLHKHFIFCNSFKDDQTNNFFCPIEADFTSKVLSMLYLSFCPVKTESNR